MSTAVLHRSHPVARLRLTRRGRVVIGAMIAIAASAIGGLVIGDGFAVATSASSAPAFEYVQVEPGQSLWQLASVIAPDADPREVIADLVHLNALQSSDVQPGQQLAIPLEYTD